MARQKTKKHNTQTATNAYKKEQVYKKQSKTKSTKKNPTNCFLFLTLLTSQFSWFQLMHNLGRVTTNLQCFA